jgi:hypothetical protein
VAVSRARTLDVLTLPLLLGLLFLFASVPAAGGAATAGSPQHTLTTVGMERNAAAASPCGPNAASGMSGTLREYGNLSPVPSVASVSLVYHYDVQTTYTPSGKGGPQVTCVPYSQSATTNSVGGFTVSVSLPSGGCTVRGCTSYAGPYGNTSFSSASAPPAGYFVHGNVTGGVAAVAIAEAYTTLRVSPPGPVLLSAEAPSRFSAYPLAADGSPSPVPFAYAWQLASAGWTLTSSASAPSVTLLASPGAAPALLGLYVNGSYGGVPFSGVVHLSVLAASTTIGSGLVSPSAVDVGGPVEFSLTGAGAPGYSYSATVTLGTGLASLRANCSAAGAPDEELSVRCSANGTYASAGKENPSATLTNGYSNATYSFGSIPISSALRLSLAPHPLATYTGDPLPLSVTVANGTGSAPYGPACVHTGLPGAPLCSSAPGPSWSFAIPYPHPGSFPLSATVGDAADTSAEAAGTVAIANRPNATASPTWTEPPTQGAPLLLSASLAGGVAPIAYWWNATNPSETFGTGTLSSSGVSNGSLTPSEPGWVSVTITWMDALGTRVVRTVSLYVSPGPAVNLATPDGTAVPAHGQAGVPVTFSIVTMSPENARVLSYSHSLTISVHAQAASDPVSLYSAALLESVVPVDGAFAIPSSAWFSGYLNFSLEFERSGRYWVSFTASLPLTFAANGSLPLSIGPDPYSLALSDPVVHVSGARTNSTEYRLSDGFGNPGIPGSVWVESDFDGAIVNRSAPVLPEGNVSLVWVNYSAPSDAGGTVSVWSADGARLLPPIAVPAANQGSDPTLPLALGSLVGLLALGGGVLWVRRSRSNRPDKPGSGEVTEEELRRSAAARERLLERIRSEAPVELARLREGWPEPAPAPAEVADWVASLVTEGAVLASMGPHGEPVYRPAPIVETSVPRVEIDSDALSRALAREERPSAEEESGAAAPEE